MERAAGWQQGLLAAVSLLVSLIGTELALRVVPLPALQRLRLRQAVAVGQHEVHPRGLYALHPVIGWTLTPGFTGRFQQEDFDIAITANSRGLRDRDYDAKAPQTCRILGLGDSFAFGWGVEAEESLYKVLERRLNDPPSDRRYEVINAGIAGFGTYEALQLLRTIGLAYEPDLVVLAFYEGNDYRNNGEAPRARMIVDGYLKDVPRQASGLPRALTDRSVLAALLETQAAHWRVKRALRADVETTKRLLLEMQRTLAARAIPLVVVFIPDQDPAVYTRSAWLRLYDRLMSGTTARQARQELTAFCRDHASTFQPLSARFADGAEAPRLRLRDTHFNRDGHQAAAEEILPIVRAAVRPR